MSGGAHFVAINEIAGNSNQRIADAADLIGPGYPNKWGAYISYNSTAEGQFFPNFATAIDRVYANNGRLLPEFYMGYQQWWNSVPGGTDAQRDIEMNSRFFNGPGRLSWLVSRKVQVWPNSQSRIHPIFSAGDHVMNASTGTAQQRESKNARFLDRLFYIYVTRSQYRALLLASNDGGVGSYKWTTRGRSARPATTHATTSSRSCSSTTR